MNNEMTPIQQVTEVLQSLKKIEVSRELSDQLNDLLPTSPPWDQSKLIDLYTEFGLLSKSDKATSNFATFEELQKAKDLLFNTQKLCLMKYVLEILGFKPKDPEGVRSDH